MNADATLLVVLGKWRWLITGSALAVLLGLICRAGGRLLAPLQTYRRFDGTCTAVSRAGTQNAVTVSFSDRNRIQHTAVLLTDDAVSAGMPLRVAVRRSVFASGALPQNAAEAAAGDVITERAYRRQLRNILLRELFIQSLTCGIALAVCLIAVKLCFPAV